jgi:hypothetical protein
VEVPYPKVVEPKPVLSVLTGLYAFREEKLKAMHRAGKEHGHRWAVMCSSK